MHRSGRGTPVSPECWRVQTGSCVVFSIAKPRIPPIFRQKEPSIIGHELNPRFQKTV